MDREIQFAVTHYQYQEKPCILSALIEQDRPAELCLEPVTAPSILGNIYIGKVKNLAPQIGAAFIEIAGGIVCYYSLAENPNPLIVNRGAENTGKALIQGDELLVQVSREALKTKAPAVTSNLNFPGKYLVLTTQNTRLGISSKIDEAQRRQLRELLQPYCGESFGLIARTNAAGAEKEALLEELEQLKRNCGKVLAKGKTRTCFSLLSEAEPAYISILKGIPREALTRITVEGEDLYQQIREYLEEMQPEDLGKLQRHQERFLSLAGLLSLEKAMDEAVRERVWLKSGGYLVIQPTEALTVIDVNTGRYEGGRKKEQTFLRINREAAVEAARQLRLRNLSGIVIIDFIDMDAEEDREMLMQLLAAELKKDPVRTVLVDMTKLGLMELTRKKVRKSLAEQLETVANQKAFC